MSTKIAWTDESWNPVVGCSRVSEGCQNCYAEKMAYRLACMGAAQRIQGDFSETSLWRKYSSVLKWGEKGGWNGEIYYDALVLNRPLYWHKPRRIFVCSMGDLFHENVLFKFINKVFDVICRCPQHTFQVLTKRPQTLYDFIGGTSGAGLSAPFLPNLHLGVTAENQKCADERIPILLQIPAAVRFVSFEPLLEEMGLRATWTRGVFGGANEKYPRIDWVIIGCESGQKRRECKLAWVGDLIGQCKAAGIPVFVKQLSINGKVEHDIKKFPEDLQIREYPT